MTTPFVRTARVLAVVGAVAGLVACTPGTQSGGGGTPKVELPAPLPDLELPGLGDAPGGNLADVKGPAVISVWASWCGPCRTEMPILETFDEEHGDAVDMVGINFQDPQEQKALKFMRERGVSYPSFRDVDGQIDRLAPFPLMKGLPFMAFVDADGQMVAAEFVIIHDVEQLETLVDKHLPGALQPASETE